MSRSYRKFPCSRMTLWGGSHNRSMKAGKRYSNRKIRRKLKDPNFDISNGNYSKRLGVNAYNLWEFKFYETKQDVINAWEREQKEIKYGIRSWRAKYSETLEEALYNWKRYYIGK